MIAQCAFCTGSCASMNVLFLHMIKCRVQMSLMSGLETFYISSYPTLGHALAAVSCTNSTQSNRKQVQSVQEIAAIDLKLDSC